MKLNWSNVHLLKFVMLDSIGSRIVSGWARDMKYKAPQVAAIFFMTSFNRDRWGPWPLAPPPGSAAVRIGTTILT